MVPSVDGKEVTHGPWIAAQGQDNVVIKRFFLDGAASHQRFLQQPAPHCKRVNKQISGVLIATEVWIAQEDGPGLLQVPTQEQVDTRPIGQQPAQAVLAPRHAAVAELILRQRQAYFQAVHDNDLAAFNEQEHVGPQIWWARLSGRLIEMQLAEVNLNGLIRRCLNEFESELKAAHPLRVVVKDSLARLPLVVADAMMMHVLFVNLIDNSIKYSHNPGAGYRYEVVISGERQANLVDINISNWGLGIDESDYSNIFSTFYRSSVRDRLHPVRGVGLGLSMCKKIVTLHDGTIKVKSVPTLDDPERLRAREGYQTTFTVRLPLNLKPGRVDIDISKSNV